MIIAQRFPHIRCDIVTKAATSDYLNRPLRTLAQAKADIQARRDRDHAVKHLAGQRIRAQLRELIERQG